MTPRSGKSKGGRNKGAKAGDVRSNGSSLPEDGGAVETTATLDLAELPDVSTEEAEMDDTPRVRRPRSGTKKPSTVPPLSAIVESILFSTDRPVTVSELSQAISGADRDAIHAALDELRDLYSSRGLDVQEMAGGYQIVTNSEYAFYVEQFLIGKRRTRLSRAALESLATIAYRQPITRGAIEELRGVDSGHVLHTLMSRDLVAVRGRSEDLGRPLLYGTTAEFLAYFGLNSLRDLPNLEEFEALSAEDPLEDPEIRSTLESHGLLSDPASEDGSSESEGASGPSLDGQNESRLENPEAAGAEHATMETDSNNAGEDQTQDTSGGAQARASLEPDADDEFIQDELPQDQDPSEDVQREDG